MKKICLLAAFAVIGLAFVSCDADALTDTNNQIKQVHADDLGKTEPATSGNTGGDGPGDDVIIILPPKKP
jgi:hypothetical protein